MIVVTQVRIRPTVLVEVFSMSKATSTCFFSNPRPRRRRRVLAPRDPSDPATPPTLVTPGCGRRSGGGTAPQTWPGPPPPPPAHRAPSQGRAPLAWAAAEADSARGPAATARAAGPAEAAAGPGGQKAREVRGACRACRPGPARWRTGLPSRPRRGARPLPSPMRRRQSRPSSRPRSLPAPRIRARFRGRFRGSCPHRLRGRAPPTPCQGIVEKSGAGFRTACGARRVNKVDWDSVRMIAMIQYRKRHQRNILSFAWICQRP